MRLSQAKENFRQLTKIFFQTAEVCFTNQSRMAKPSVPLITIATGPVHRSLFSSNENIAGATVASYPARVNVTVDLFTHGKEVVDDETGKVIGYEDSAVDDMLSFVDFLSSSYTVDWCRNKDMAVQLDGDVQNLTGIVNDTNYEYRSRISLWLFYTHRAIGYSAALKEDSVTFPRVEKDEEGNDKVVYGPEPPLPDTSSTGESNKDNYDVTVSVPSEEDPNVHYDVTYGPIFEPIPLDTTAGGGGSEELVNAETGYFTEVEIKEEEDL